MPVLRFPVDSSLGKLRARPDLGFEPFEPEFEHLDDDRPWFDLGEARGEVDAPEGVAFFLSVRGEESPDLAAVSAFPPGTLRYVSFRGALNEVDLRYLEFHEGIAF